jgi:hypothetical protein
MSAPAVCSCRFCGEEYEPAGITNHETYCEENPNSGVPVEKQKELGIFDEPNSSDLTADPSSETEATPERANPDQEASTDGGTLPPREKLPGTNKDEPKRCPNCKSDDIMPAHEAREAFKEELGGIPDELRTTLDAAEHYCNECWYVSGGELGSPWGIA